MPWREFRDWQEFSLVHPFPADLIDLHGAMHMAAFHNVHRAKDAPPFSAAEFMIVRGWPVASPPEPEPSEAEKMRAAMGG